jgi:hypothetical protein
MGWKEIRTQADADALMKLFGEFHDGCIREAHVWTEHWVGRDRSMSCPDHLDNHIRILVQRQFTDPAAIELLFDEVTRFNLVPARENYMAIILDAFMLVQDGIIYWSPDSRWSPDSVYRDDVTWISARQLRWREVDWLGEALRYGPSENA